MSNKLTRKGLAFGAMVALGASTLVGLPATADTTGPVTLVPNNDGTTFNSILQSGVSLKSELDPNSIGIEEAGSLSFLVENPGAKAIAVEFDSAGGTLDGMLVNTTDTSAATSAFTGLANANRLNNATDEGKYDSDAYRASSNKFVYVTGATSNNVSTFFDAIYQKEIQLAAVTPSEDGAYSFTLPNGATLSTGTITGTPTVATIVSTLKADVDFDVNYADLGSSGGNMTITYQAIGVEYAETAAGTGIGASSESQDHRRSTGTWNFGTTSNETVLNIYTTETTSSVTLYVRAWLDADGDGKIDTFEKSSDRETVVLYAPGTYSATTTMFDTTRDDTVMQARVVYNNNINSYFVAEDTYVEFYKDGVLIDEDDGDTGDIDAYGRIVVEDGYYEDLDDPTLGSAVYHARALYDTGSDVYYVGARSVALDLRNGSNTAVDDVRPVVTESTNVAFDDEDEIDVRTGTKSLTVAAQVTDGGVDLAASNIQVRATVTGVELGSTSAVTVTGAPGTIAEADDEIVATGFTNSTGRVSFVINNSVGATDDELDIYLEVKQSDGTWEEYGYTITALWQVATLSSFEPSAEVVSGATVNVEFKAADQWGVGLDSSATLGRYSVHVQAYIAGVVKPTTYSETKVTTNGVAAFSFTNFVTAGNNEEIVATLKNGNADVASSGPIVNPVYVDVYNNLATDSITLSDVYEARVSYVDYVVGDLDTAAVAKEADDKGVLDAFADDTHAVINGTVLNANNQGQPGAAVTVAVPGALLWDPVTNILAKDTISTVANSLGYFEVEALVQKMNTAGATITVTSGGKSATSKLKSYLPYNLSAQNLKLSWTLPTVVVKNTTYSVKATLTDVWGNPLRSWEPSNYSHVDFSAAGALQVNGEDSVAKEFNAAGEVTVFLRSVADVGGPGTLTMTLDEDDYEYATGKSGEYDDVTDTTSEFEDNSFTSWDESKWSGSLSAEFDVKDVAPVTGKVNVGSFNGKLVVYASGLNGARISWKVGGNWGSAVATSNYSIFNRPTPRAGATVSVEVFVNGVKQLTKSVVTR